jgi:hypothetical protein
MSVPWRFGTAYTCTTKTFGKEACAGNRWGRHLTPAGQKFNEKYKTAIRYLTISHTVLHVFYE